MAYGKMQAPAALTSQDATIQPLHSLSQLPINRDTSGLSCQENAINPQLSEEVGRSEDWEGQYKEQAKDYEYATDSFALLYLEERSKRVIYADANLHCAVSTFPPEHTYAFVLSSTAVMVPIAKTWRELQKNFPRVDSISRIRDPFN